MEVLRQKIAMRILAGDRPSDIARRFRVARATVYCTKAIHRATGGFSKRSYRPSPSIRTAAFMADLKQTINDDPEISMQCLAKDKGVSLARTKEKTIRKCVKEDLGKRSRAKRKVQMLMTAQRVKRLQRSKKMLLALKSKKCDVVVLFSDEKNFVVDVHHNCRNSRFIAKSISDVPNSVRYVNTTKKPAKAMMFGLVASDGAVMPPIWIKGTLKTKGYLEIAAKVLDWADRRYGRGKYIYQQDSTPCHTSKATQAYLMSELGSKGFWSKDFWPPSSPNLNPLDFSIWTHVAQEACHTSHQSVDSMKSTVEDVWNNMSVAYIKSTCATFRPRLEHCIAAGGGIFEK